MRDEKKAVVKESKEEVEADTVVDKLVLLMEKRKR